MLRNADDLAALVRERRKECGLSQGEVARLANLRRATVVDLEAGKSRPTFDTALAVLSALGVGLDARIGGAQLFERAWVGVLVDLDEVLADVRRSTS